MTNINAVDVRYLYLIRLNFDTLDVFELSQSPSLPHVFLHLVNVLYKYLIQLALLIHLLLIERFNPTIDPLTLLNLTAELFLELPLHIRLPNRVESEVFLDLTCELFFGRSDLPLSLHEVRQFRIACL